MDVLGENDLFIIYSGNGNAFYQGLARRLATAREESGREVVLRTAEEVSEMTPEQLRGVALALVNPFECAFRMSDKTKLFDALSAARRRIMVLAEALETRWFEQQLSLPVDFDLLVDVGFLSQEDKRSFPEEPSGSSGMPYRFVFNGPTEREWKKIMADGAPSRPIPWALVGHKTEGRARLTMELMERLGPGGFVFLPDPGLGVRKTGSNIGPSALDSVLSSTEYYVWSAHHEFVYYESFRFIEALLCGAVPCKIDENPAWERLGVPGVFPSVEALQERIRSEGFASLQRFAREFYLSQDTLAYHVEEALGDV